MWLAATLLHSAVLRDILQVSITSDKNPGRMGVETGLPLTVGNLNFLSSFSIIVICIIFIIIRIL